MSKVQASKKAQQARRKAKILGLHRNVGHPSHYSTKRWKIKDSQRISDYILKSVSAELE